jgi:tripartite-type tricarboxylate transporter receptor subunit TctC
MTRSAVLPDIPTFDESGVKRFESSIAHGILAPARVPAVTLARLNRDLNETLGEPDYRKRMAEFGADLVGGSGKEFQAFLAAETRKWAAVIKKRGIKAE